MTAAPKGVERPDDAGGADVEALQGQRRVARVPLVCGPEAFGGECGVGIGNDRGDRVPHPRRIPRLRDQRLEVGGVVEHGRSIVPFGHGRGPAPDVAETDSREGR